MANHSLQALMREKGNVVQMLRNSKIGMYVYPVVANEFTNWRDEQRAWRETAVLFDQTHHMDELIVEGPQAAEFLSHVGVNSFSNFDLNRAKHFVPVTPTGHVIGDMIIFRENSEDIYAGIEWAADSPEATKLIRFLREEMGVTQIRFPEGCGIGIKPVSREGTQRLVRKAIQYAIDNDKDSVTLVHKGNIMKYTEGAFKDWGYQLAGDRFGAELLDGGPWMTMKNPRTGKDIIIKDVIADAFLQQILMRPADYSVIATLNLNGDYISDALAAEVGGIGIAPGANIGGSVSLFEATHGTAPKYAGQDKVNPGSLILSAEMMLRHMGWNDAADLIINGVEGAIAAKTVTYDFERLMPDATLLKCSEFGDAVIEHMGI